MESKMESDNSYSGDSSSSSDSSSGSSQGDEEVLEPVRILGNTLELPQELCEDYSIFKEVFSIKTWESLQEDQKQHLLNYLPKFGEDENEEKDKTLKMLLNFEPFHFNSPLDEFYNNLRQGNYRPDIAKMRKFLRKARAKQQKHKMKSYFAKLLPDVLLSRERLLAVVKALPPGSIPRIPPLPQKHSSKGNFKPLFLRARQRYFEELSAIRGEVGGDESEDENFPDGPPEPSVKKRKHGVLGQMDSNVTGTLGGMDSTSPTSVECLKNVLASHRSRRQYRESHPELNTAGITLDDIKQRVAVLNGSKNLLFGGQKADTPMQKLKRGPKPKDPNLKQKPDRIKKTKDEPVHENVENKPLLPNIKIKCEQEESDSESSSFVDPVSTSPRQLRKSESVEIKQEVTDSKYPDCTNINYNDPKLDAVIKQEPLDRPVLDSSGKIVQPIPLKLEDLDGIDMMALPVELADDSGEVLVDTSTEADCPADGDDTLSETTYANFLSLVRALFPARAAHRASKQQLYARCANIIKSPIAPLNAWYNLSDDWCADLESALDFLAGERGPHPDDFVPYLQFMPETQMYQWIGAGRDGDATLGRLCERWLRCSEPAAAPDPPPPRYPTSWVMRPPTSSEVNEFRAQERRRFSSAAKPFTYLQHGYRAVVGPCSRGAGGAGGAAGAGVAGGGAAGAGAVLASCRPRHATLLALVRDAVARLPNGEGSKRDISTLLKMSQWITACSDQILLSAVSTILDKLHTVKKDPFVKYDQRSAIWTYLHRHKTEEDWLKSPNPKSRVKPTGLQASAEHKLHSPQSAMELEVATEEIVENGSDSDVDVEDTGGTHLSSAQLLMQAQATQTKQTPKPKPKVVATPPKPKPQVKPPAVQQANKPNLLVQSAKQANLLAQSVKQAIAQSKQTAPKQTITTKVETKMANQSKTPTVPLKQAMKTASSISQPKPALMAQSAKQANIIAQLTKQSIAKQTNAAAKPQTQSAKEVASLKVSATPNKAVQSIKTTVTAKQAPSVPATESTAAHMTIPHQSALQKQRASMKPETGAIQVQSSAAVTSSAHVVSSTLLAQQMQNKMAVVTRSLLIRPQTTGAVTAVSSAVNQAVTSRRSVVRVLSPATSSGKSLISPHALIQTSTPTAKKRTSVLNPTVTTMAHGSSNAMTHISSAPTQATPSVATRTLQLGGRTVQLAANQTVHLPGGQAVQLASGHTLQLSSLQLPTHSVRLPSGQTVQLAAPQTVQAVRVSNATVKTTNPRLHQTSPIVKTSQPTVQIPVSSVQLAGQTVQIGGQSVQLSQNLQLTGHTVKLPSGQSVQLAGQSVQLPSGQTVQIGGNMQTVLAGQSVQMPSGQSVQLGSQTLQIGGQTVQLGGQTVQLSSGQTLQLSGQTVQLGGQTLQLASGQTVQLANQHSQKPVTQVVRAQTSADKSSQPIVAKLLAGAQGGMISVDTRPMAAAARGRLLSPARLARPLLLTSKPLHNLILQQSDGSAIRVTSSGGTVTSQTIVLGNIGGQSGTATTSSPPVLKLQQVNPLQQVKLAQGIKIQQPGVTGAASSSGVRSVLMDGQQLKLVGGRHVLARLLRPTNPPQ